MNTTQPSGRPDAEFGRVEIRVKGRLEPRWNAWFDGMDITAASDGTTVIHGPVVDQAALFGVLQRVRDVALPLISVIHVDPDHRPDPDASTANQQPDPTL